ncbi:LANO_0A06348g1_1 [Lachancea nothofagi CBS 11611]|uniref:LANO_0A06348g1_1 n=1 Tax=Lachancea nothofagi CBS 11611 TaxID=1266666 RepID=A0A1G4IRS1_9SACH|nr:LANO_0A06348g1_1 [Lachancea nothofagi CBS 11611]
MIKAAGRSISLNTFRSYPAWYTRPFSSSSSSLSKEQIFLLNRTINAPVSEVYNVVSEISQYKEFMKYCTESFVDKRDPNTGKPLEAGLRVGFQQYDETFVCQIRCERDSRDRCVVIADSVTHSLFDALQTKWIINPHPSRSGATEAELHLKFKFKFSLYNNIASIFGKSVTELVMKSFERRIFTLMRQASKTKPAGTSRDVI